MTKKSIRFPPLKFIFLLLRKKLVRDFSDFLFHPVWQQHNIMTWREIILWYQSKFLFRLPEKKQKRTKKSEKGLNNKKNQEYYMN